MSDFSGDVSSALLRRAREISSLLSGVAEHHPYWPAAHYLAQAMEMLFEKWNADLTEAELDELLWHLEKARDALQRLKGGEDSDI
ncbi:MAG: hypothetical protein ACP5HD_03225 [Thermoproteus sp.]